MKVVPREGERDLNTNLGFEDGSTLDSWNRQLPLDAMRSWLVSGVQFVDPRRRFGGHGRTREMLVVDQPARYGPSARWQTLTAALGRHTVQGGLSKLSPEERRVITLAYLEGRTNRQIAAILGVSVTTVRRRLLGAVERLDAYISHTGTAILIFVLAVATFVTSHAARLGHRFTSAISSADKVEAVVATVSVGVVTAAAVGGILAFTSQSAPSSKAPPAASARLIHTNDAGLLPLNETRPQIVPTLSDRAKPVVGGGSKTNPDSTGTSQTAGSRNNGCDGNPTSAPPPVPVGPRGHPTGAPVTHPGPGGCKA